MEVWSDRGSQQVPMGENGQSMLGKRHEYPASIVADNGRSHSMEARGHLYGPQQATDPGIFRAARVPDEGVGIRATVFSKL